MKSFARVLPVVVALAVFAPLRAGEPETRTTTAADGERVNLTIYNSGRALVTDRRRLTLPTGKIALNFADVAQQLMPETVSIKSLTAPEGLSVIEQNFEYDLLSPRKLLDKYVGQPVTLVVRETQNNSTVEKKIPAILLSNNEAPVWKIGDSIVTGDFAARYEFPKVPANLIATPTLAWLLDNSTAKPQSIEASYLTQGISWKSDYVLTLAADSKSAGLDGWVTIQNNSGATYRDARLQLIAGDVNQVQPQPGMMQRGQVAMDGASAAAPQFQEKSFFEYHLYTLQRPATVKENQQKQISLLSAAGVQVEKVLRLRGQQWYYSQQYGGGDEQKVEVALRLRNSQANHMGMPLPKGIVRVYQKEEDGAAQFVGEDQIDHTPKDETLDLRIGSAFDIKAERKQTDFKIINNCTYEMAYEISLRNHKAEPVTILVTEPIGGEWTMLESSVPHTQTAAFWAEFRVPVAKDSETKLRYRVRVKYCK